ncbi:MAG: DNA topoisomerase VI subunit B, partial [Methanomassiliicoccales archaeon]
GDLVVVTQDGLDEIELALRACGRKLKSHLNKKETQKKTRAKFEIVRELLPQIAEKSASIVGKETPDLSRTITKIMNVVWVEDHLEYVDGKHRVTIRVHNYTPKRQKFNLHSIIPEGAMFGGCSSIRPTDIRNGGKVTWELKSIPSAQSKEIIFDLMGLDQEDYDENWIYVSGINPAHVIGADPLPGDWDLEEVPAAEVEPEDEEPDYDEAGEVLSDE